MAREAAAHDLPTTSYAVLGLLTFGEMSGYDVLKMAERSVGYFWSPAKSQVYAELRRLRELGLAEERGVRQHGRPDKRLYRITDDGLAALERWLDAGEVEPEQVRSAFLLKLFFGDRMERDVLLEQLRAMRDHAAATLAELRAIEPRLDLEGPGFFPYLTLKAGLAHCEASRRWAEEAIALVERRAERARGAAPATTRKEA